MNKKDIKNDLKNNSLHAKKYYGQNFLSDEKILKEIIDKSDLTKDDFVIEIGPGLGSLTTHLIKKAGFVLCYEIDSDLIPILKNNISFNNNYEIINEDVLKRDVNKDIEIYAKNYKNIYVIANIPYYITTPIILGLLSQTDKIKKYVLMVQKEVADRIVSEPKKKDYNSLSIAIGYRCERKILINVPKEAFTPAPNVDSAVIELKLFKELPFKAKNEELFFKLIRFSFEMRRKTLVNNLSNHFDKNLVLNALEKLTLSKTVRSEELSIKNFVDLSDFINENLEKKIWR